MKNKILNLTFILMLALGFVFTTSSSNAVAAPVQSVAVALDGLDWMVTPSTAFQREIPMSMVTPSLLPGLQLMGDGVVITAPAKICHPFRGGQFGWQGQIRMLSGSNWVPLATTVMWTPTIEGNLIACANAPSAGTYALFAYWKLGNTVGVPSTVPGTPISFDQAWVTTPITSEIREIPMNLVTPVFLPSVQLQLMSTGLMLSAPAKICYPFRGGQFGWRGQIRLLYGNKWVPLATTVVWTPTIEGKLMACANAPSAGTYALFAYWQPLP